MAKFDPKAHLSKLKGKDYLEVKWRLVWFRDVWPHGTITTEAIELTDQRAVFRATVTAVDAEGTVRGSATGTKSETPRGFADYIEKAETGSIGRALAALGFGTQFDPELEEGERVVDSPVQRAPQRATRPAETPQPAPAAPTAVADRDAMMKRLHAKASHDLLHAVALVWKFDSLTAMPDMLLAELDALLDGKGPKDRQERFNAWRFKWEHENPPVAPAQSGLHIELPAEDEDRMRATRYTQL